MKDLLEKLKSGEISQRSFIATIKKSESYINEVVNETAFLNEYNPDILERIYYIINDIHETVRCPYCQNKAKWTNRINEGYKTTCCSKECESKRISEQKQGLTNISENRDKQFIDWQSNVDEKEINDEFIKDNIKYDKQISLLTNPFIKSYLESRFKDSSSLLESYQRIVMGVEEKPKCPVCGKPVTWVGKRTKLVTTYCSDKCSANSEITKQKKVDTLLTNWKAKSTPESEIYKQMILEKYGYEYTSQIPEVIEKRKKTLRKKYGTTNLYAIDGITDKINKTNRERYGVDWVFQRTDIRDKAYKANMENGGSSKQEDYVYDMLIELGYNVERQKRIPDTNWCIDFYLSDYDLYIEYQGSQYHNGRAFLGTKEDLFELELLKKKDKERKKITNESTQYEGIINTWTKRDVEKREWMLNHNYNFLELYDCLYIDSLKSQLELYIDCLKDKNCFRRYYTSEVIFNEFEYYNHMYIDDLNKKYSSNNNRIVKFFQDSFYKKEREVYAHNPILRRKLIQNRCKYLNKKERALTISEIFSGFKNSGIYYGYSHFNPAWTNWFVNNFNIKSVYDPCGGWGHHILGMLSCDRIIYNDLSESTYNGVVEMKNYFHIDNLECHCEDGKTFISDDVDAWFMCPPYYNLEHYECGDFDSIDEYKGFLNDIFELWNKSTAKIFGVIIREDLVDLINYEYSDRHDLNITNVSYISGGKRFKEYFYIFKKE